jgi:integrase/recombinase XerD
MKNERDTFSVSFFIRRERIVNGNLPLYCFITLKGDKCKLNTKLQIPERYWDSSRGKPKGSSIEVRELIQKLDEIKSCIFQIYHDFKISGKAFTNLNIRNKFMGIADDLTTDPTDKYTLMMLFDYHQEISKNTYVKATLNHYLVSKRYFHEFLETEYNKSDIKLKDLTY